MWARIPSDPIFPTIPPPNSVPALIPLGKSGRCASCDILYDSDPAKSTKTIMCKIFGFTHAWRTKIEVQDCPGCQRGVIGPDCGDLGIFNWNNRTLFMHALLDDYTSNYTTSETPFIAWVGVMSRRYNTFESPVNFPSDKYFREIWFAYIVLMKLEGEFTCPACGKSPRVTIWDGITLSFSKKHILPTIHPPTTTTDGSPIRPRVAPVRKQQFIGDSMLRKDLRGFVEGAPVDTTVLSLEALEIRETDARERAATRRERSDEVEHITQVENFRRRLEKVSQELGDFFNDVYAIKEGNTQARPPRVYKQLLQHLAAEESALQMVNGADMGHLLAFLGNPNRSTMSGLVGIPALFRVVCHEVKVFRAPKISTMKLAEWIFLRSATVLNMLKGQQDEGASETYNMVDDSWQKVGDNS